MKAIFAFCYHKKTDLLATIAALYAAIVVIPARFDTTELEQLLRHEFEAHTQILDETLTEKYPIVLALETRSSHSYQKANFGEIVSKNTSMNDYIDSLLAKIAHDEPIYNTDLHRATTLFDSLNHAILQYIEPRDSAITAQIYEVPIAYSTYNLTNEQIKDILWVLKLQSIYSA